MTARTVAIDGPVASGKSAVGRLLAQRLGYGFLDTGLMYRAVTLAALSRGLPVDDPQALRDLVRDIEIGVHGDCIFLDGEDVTQRLRSPEIDDAVSRYVSKVPAVRERMVDQQREIARQGNVVMVGRDIGTVVLPDAELKVYLDAGVEERARRRHAEMDDGDQPATVAEIEEALRIRDQTDSSRELSPLRPAADAHMIHTDGMTIDEVVSEIEQLARND